MKRRPTKPNAISEPEQPCVASRRGVSLAEMVIVIGVFAVFLSAALTMLHTVLRAESRVRETVAGQGSLLRISRLFREDLVTAASLKEPPLAGKVRVGIVTAVSGGQHVQWESRGNTVIRRVLQDQREVQRDIFRVGGRSDFLVESGSQVFVTLNVYREQATYRNKTTATGNAKLLMSFTAAVGRRQTFLATPARAESSGN